MMRPALSKQSEPPWATSQNQLSCRATELRTQALNKPSGSGGLEMAKGGFESTRLSKHCG